MAVEAREEGFNNIAFLFEAVGKIEKDHEGRYLALLKSLEEGAIFAKPEKAVWVCRNCGHVSEGQKAPEKCAVCVHPKSYFELKATNY
jgi:rubrerythrin